MIHIKLLSGEVMEVEVSQSITVVELRSRMKHPFPVFFRGGEGARSRGYGKPV